MSLFFLALVFSYDFHAGAETMFSRHFNDPAADSYFTKRKWGELVFPPFHLQNEKEPASRQKPIFTLLLQTF